MIMQFTRSSVFGAQRGEQLYLELSCVVRSQELTLLVWKPLSLTLPWLGPSWAHTSGMKAQETHTSVIRSQETHTSVIMSQEIHTSVIRSKETSHIRD